MAYQRTQQPVTTGTSVLGIAFDGGVIIAADTLASYGSLARYRDVSRVLQVNDKTVLGCGGDYADFQTLAASIEQKQIDEECHADGFTLSPKSLYSWLTRIQYHRRSKFDPFWTSWVVGGIEEDHETGGPGKPFLGYVDMLGTAYKDTAIATGYGAYIAIPLLRQLTERKTPITEAEARAKIEECMKVLYCRDARSLPRYHLVVSTAAGSKIEGPITFDADWNIAEYVKGYE